MTLYYKNIFFSFSLSALFPVSIHTVFDLFKNFPKSEYSPSSILMIQLIFFILKDSVEGFREEACAFRNARERAKTQRDDIIAAANDRIMGISKDTFTLKTSMCNMTQSTVEAGAIDSETSADELAQNVDQSLGLFNKRLQR
jgi:hypothetical protein